MSFHLDEVGRLVLLARDVLAANPELGPLLSRRDARIAAIIWVLETSPDELLQAAVSSVKPGLRQDEPTKHELASAERAALDAEYELVDELISALS